MEPDIHVHEVHLHHVCIKLVDRAKVQLKGCAVVQSSAGEESEDCRCAHPFS